MILTSILAIDDFSGGLNTKAGTMQLENNQTPNCINCTSNLFKSLVARNGMEKLNTAVISGTWASNGLVDFPYWSGGVLIHQQIDFAGTAMYKMDNLDGTYDTVTAKTSLSNALYSATIYSNTTTNYMIFTNDGMITPEIYDGTSCNSISLTAISSAISVISWKRHTWWAYTKEGGTNYPYRLRRTDVGTIGATA